MRCVTYNFQPEFAEAILSGRKMSTIRLSGKRRHAKTGEELRLYVGMRTKSCRLLMSVPCLCSRSVEIHPWGAAFDGFLCEFRKLEALAAVEGFATGKDMLAWFDKRYGLPVSNLTQIRWNPAQATYVAKSAVPEGQS